ncbi:MAG: hypothetical protein RLZZ611_2216 [Cyanobacteriota bacterium]|jgi:hypothetical protein
MALFQQPIGLASQQQGAGCETTPTPGLGLDAQDAVSNYFECITACSLDDGECVTRCVEVLRETP